jgi:decaprenyl-phosphate phosphoribosyltransferase
MKMAIDILRLLRPRQWIKNLAVFTAIIFAGQLFEVSVFNKVFLAFISFCALSSATYVINDLFDIKKDRLHPFKKFRPLAKGSISIPLAITLVIILAAGSILLSFYVTPAFTIIVIIYFVIQFLYSLLFKAIAAMDILIIATGYILRVYAGEFASGFHISVWMLLTTISFSLFLAVGKRRSELTLLSNNKASNIAETRQSLSHYSEKLLDVYACMFATSAFITYSLFTFLESPRGIKIALGVLMPDFLPLFFQRKWLMITIIPVVYGIMRYLQDIYEKNEGESPERVLLSDRPLLTTVILWGLLVIFIIYFVGP